MKKLISFIFIIVFSVALSCINVNAETYDDLADSTGASDLYGALPDEVQDTLSSLGVTEVDYTQLNEISFKSIMSEIGDIVADQGSTPLKIMSSVIGIMLLYSLVFGMKSFSKTTSMENVLSLCITLCITCVIVIPISNVITSGMEVICTASDFMLAYIPVMLLIMVSGGYAVSGSSYYSLMIFAGQAVGQVSTNIISPFLQMFLGLSITSAVSPSINLRGMVEFIGKITKWMLGFIMTVFTALLTFRQLITTAMDNVSTRAVRFTLTSLIPVVGSALSDAYKTVQSSVGLLKSGVGVFVIFAVGIVFLPSLVKCLFWMISLGLCKSVGEILNLKEPVEILSCVQVVITTVFAILLCVMSVYIILTALVLLLGGGGV